MSHPSSVLTEVDALLKNRASKTVKKIKVIVQQYADIYLTE